jgi:hypothetical protein
MWRLEVQPAVAVQGFVSNVIREDEQDVGFFGRCDTQEGDEQEADEMRAESIHEGSLISWLQRRRVTSLLVAGVLIVAPGTWTDSWGVFDRAEEGRWVTPVPS